MDTVVIKGGKFSFTASARDLSRGLRMTARAPRNSEFLTSCVGAVGTEGVLRVLYAITRLDTSTIKDCFPFPQIFVFTNLIIVCGRSKIYEWVSGSLVLKYTATKINGLWTAVDFFDYIYLSNGEEAVIRNAGSKTYSASTVLPAASTICNYNGQVLVGAPDMSGLATNHVLVADEIDASITILGSLSIT